MEANALRGRTDKAPPVEGLRPALAAPAGEYVVGVGDAVLGSESLSWQSELDGDEMSASDLRGGR